MESRPYDELRIRDADNNEIKLEYGKETYKKDEVNGLAVNFLNTYLDN